MKKWLVWLSLLAVVAVAGGWGVSRLIAPKAPPTPGYTETDYQSAQSRLREFGNELFRRPGESAVLSLSSEQINALAANELGTVLTRISGQPVEGVTVRLREGRVSLESAAGLAGTSLGVGLDLRPEVQSGDLRLKVTEARVAGVPVPVSRLMQLAQSAAGVGAGGAGVGGAEVSGAATGPGILGGLMFDPADGALVVKSARMGDRAPVFESIEVAETGLKVIMRAPTGVPAKP